MKSPALFFCLFVFIFSCGRENVRDGKSSLKKDGNYEEKLPLNIDELSTSKGDLNQINRITFLEGSNIPYSGFSNDIIAGKKNIIQFKDGWVVRHVTFHSNGLKEKDISFRPNSVEMNKYLNPPRGTKRGKFSEWYRNGKKKTEFNYDDSGRQIGA